jgi:hypothetical protein
VSSGITGVALPALRQILQRMLKPAAFRDLSYGDLAGAQVDSNGDPLVSVNTDGTTISGGTIDESTGTQEPISLVTPVSVENGGTGTDDPGLIAGSGIEITGDWPDQTISATGGGASAAMILMPLPFADSPYTAALSADAWTLFMASSGASADFVFNLPAATGSGEVAVIKKMDGNAHNIAITPNGTDTIDGVNAVLNIVPQYATVTLVDSGEGTWSQI